jgi:hypothetical protein
MRLFRVRLYNLPFTFANETTPLDGKCRSLLEKMDGKLEALLTHIIDWVTAMDDLSTFPVFKTKDLRALSDRREESVRRLAILRTRVDPAKFPPPGGTGTGQ